MATVTWVGKQIARPKVAEVTVGSAVAGTTFQATAGLTRVVSYTAVTGDTTATVAAALLALLQAEPSGEFRELTWAVGSTTSKVSATGPADGAIFTLAVGGTGTISVATLTAPLSPHDAADGANYSTGALPAGNDTLVFESSDVDVLYNLAALTALALTVIRRRTFTGRWGLPDTSAAGYPEYRNTHFELNTTSLTVVQPAADRAGQLRVKGTSGSAATVVVRGDGGAALDAEALDLYGLVSTSVVQVTGGSIALAVLAGQTAVVSTLAGEDAAVRCGSGVTLTTPTLKNCQFRLDCSWTTLTVLEGGDGEVTGSAGGGAAGTLVYAGNLLWRSSGGPGNSPVVGPAGTIDFSQAPANVAVGGTVELNAGSAWLDPAGRVTTSYTVKLNRCRLEDVTLRLGPNKTLAIS